MSGSRLRWVLGAALALGASLCGLAQSPFSSGLPSSQSTSQDTPSSQPDINVQQQSTPTTMGPRSLDQNLTNQQQDQNTLNPNRTERNGRYPVDNPLEPVPLTGFQRMVAASVGRVLPIYGANLFTNVPSTFAPVDRIPVTPDYVIGPGDELLIRIWGQVTLNGRYTVDRSGNVYIPQVGAVRVAGISFAQLTEYLRSQIAHNFRNFDLNVNIGQLRSIQIFIVGESKRPGSYTISSLSTLVNAVFASGGPSSMGSMRNIQVKRGGETVTTFDMYDLLLHGDKSKDVQLLSGDVIYIAPVGPMVAVAGSVDVPALYELKPPSTVKDVLALAGGLSTMAQDKEIHVERISRQDSRSVLDIKLDAGGLATALNDGDVLEVTPIVDRFKDAVTLRGNVADPRRFAWVPGMRIRDLIPDKEALLTRDYWQKRNQLGLPVLDSTPDVRRYAPDTPVAQLNGRGIGPIKSPLLLNSANTPDDDTNIYGVRGQVPLYGPYGYAVGSDSSSNGYSQGNANGIPQNDSSSSLSMPTSPGTAGALASVLDPASANNNVPQGSVNYGHSMLGPSEAQTGSESNATGTAVGATVTDAARRFPVKNAVVLSAPEVDWVYAVVQRLNPHDLTTQLLPFNLGKAVLDGDPKENLELQPGDVVTVFSKADIRVPQSQQTKYVRLEGEFKASGTYSIQPGETLRQLVARVGLTSEAYLYGSQFNRESTRVLQQQRLNDYAAELDRRIRLAEANAANSQLNPQDQITDIAALQNARTVSLRLRQLRASGRIVLDIHPSAQSIDDVPDLPLEDGDAFIVPQIPSTVDVFGSVYTQTSFLYNSHLKAGDYMRQAGGGTRTADVKRSYIVRADGSVISRQFSNSLFSGSFESTRLFPGDAVIVPEAVDRRPLLRNLVDIATIVGQFGLGVAAVNVLK